MDKGEEMTVFGDPVFDEPMIDSQTITPTKAHSKSSKLAKMQREPARWVALIGAFITLGMAFGLEIDEKQFGAIVSVVMLLIGEITRGKVKPADTE